LGREEDGTDLALGKRFREFLSSQVRRSPVRMVEDHVAWEEPRAYTEQTSGTAETGKGLLHTVFAEDEVLDSITLTKAEAELLRRQIRDLDLRLGRLLRWNRMLKVAVIALCCLTVIMVIARFIRVW